MPFDRQHTYLTWGGRLTTAAEDYWQCGIRMAFLTNTLVPPAFTSGMLADAAAALGTFHGAAATGICTGAKLDWVKAAYLNEDGTYDDEPQVIDGLDGSGGGLGESSASPSTSVAVTLWSGATFGRANYGRFYTPWNTLLVSATNGKIGDTARDGLAGTAATLVTALNNIGADAPGTEDLHVVVMSSLDLGTTKEVTQVRVGNVKDVQQRRSNRLGEAYASVGV